jgi:hypothetical protein
MPKRKWNRLHDDASIDDERLHRAHALYEQREARATIEEALAEPRPQPPDPNADAPPNPDPDPTE